VRYAFTTVEAVRSYSPSTGAISLEMLTAIFGNSFWMRSLARVSCDGFRNDQMKETAMASHPASTSSRAAARTSSSFSATMTAPL
jgi:hypothetical protein